MRYLSFLALLFVSAEAVAIGKSQQLASAFCPFQTKAAKALIDPSLLHDTPLAVISDEFREKEKVYGGCRAVKEKEPGQYEFRYAEAIYSISVDWSPQGKLLSYEAGRPMILNDSFEKIAASAEKLFPGSSLYVEAEAKELFGHNSLKPLNVSHSAQLFLLSTLEDQVAARRVKLDQVVRVSPRVKATALGALHFWNEGSAVTVDALKNMVIAEGDQTASDLLLETLTSGEVERLGQNLSPFISHRQFAQLMDEDRRVPSRREDLKELLKKLDEDLGRVESHDQHAKRVATVGWFASTQELCAAFRKLRNEPALFSAANVKYEREQHEISWPDLALKDVTANGVRQVTAMLRNGPGSPLFCFSLTSNHRDLISETQFNDLKYRIIRVILSKK